MIDWSAFLIVLVSALSGTVLVVGFYSLGLRLLSVAGRIPLVEPAEFTDQLTVITPKQARLALKERRKAAKRIPLTPLQKQCALVGGYACFAVTGFAVLLGVYLIVPALHG